MSSRIARFKCGKFLFVRIAEITFASIRFFSIVQKINVKTLPLISDVKQSPKCTEGSQCKLFLNPKFLKNYRFFPPPWPNLETLQNWKNHRMCKKHIFKKLCSCELFPFFRNSITLFFPKINRGYFGKNIRF